MVRQNEKRDDKKINLFFILLTIIFISGCETISAIKTGNITSNDMLNMVRLRNSSTEKTASIKTENTVLKNIKKTDSWIQQNLW